jgi:DNA-binding response OmpR family regulator
LRLLVIEDEDRLSGILKSKLGDIGFTVDIAGSAADASAALELNDPGSRRVYHAGSWRSSSR